MLSKFKKNYFLIISSLLIFYFSINLFGGERGLFSYFEKREKIQKLKLKEIELINKINDLDYKNSLLSDNLDFDYIDILIRDKLMLGKRGEITYMLKTNDD